MPSSKFSQSASEKVLRKLNGVNAIAPFPHVVGELIEATKSVDADVATIVEIIERDPALTMKTLRMANSPIYGLASVIQSVRHAISLLGFTKIRNIALTYAASSIMMGKGPQQSFKKTLWKHSLGCATVARQIATLVKRDDDAAFLGGIFHDIGKLFLIDVVPEVYAELCQNHYGTELVQLEREILHTDHQKVGEILATDWQLPEILRLVIGYHHQPREALAHQDICQIVSVADSISRHLLEGGCTDEAELSFCEEAASALGITEELVQEVLQDAMQAFEDATVACE